VWVFLLFVEQTPVMGKLENGAAVVVPATWIATLIGRGRVHHQIWLCWREIAVVIAFIVWLVLSVGWAQDSAAAGRVAKAWVFGAAIFPILATSLVAPRHILYVVGGFVAGALTSVGLGVLGVTSAPAMLAFGAPTFSGAEGDANVFAAAIVAAIPLAGGLFLALRRPTGRTGLVLIAVALAAALLASGSRGAIVAAAVAGVCALILLRQHRRYLALLLVFLLACTIALPVTRERFGELAAGGSAGRDDLSRIALRIARDHPIVGVGLNDFRAENPRYVREPGELDDIELITDQPQVVHNTYLEVLTEMGVVGLALLLTIAATSVRAGWLASRRFELLEDPQLVTLARAVLVALAAALATALFMSNGYDKRLWVMLALPVALAGVRSRSGELPLMRL
jgi:O-antigen ligase